MVAKALPKIHPPPPAETAYRRVDVGPDQPYWLRALADGSHPIALHVVGETSRHGTLHADRLLAVYRDAGGGLWVDVGCRAAVVSVAVAHVMYAAMPDGWRQKERERLARQEAGA